MVHTVRMVTPGPLQFVAYGGFIFFSGFFGFLYITNPGSLLFRHELRTDSEAVTFFVEYLVRCMGVAMLTVAIAMYLVGIQDKRAYICMAGLASLETYTHVNTASKASSAAVAGFDPTMAFTLASLSGVLALFNLLAWLFFPKARLVNVGRVKPKRQ